MPSVRRKVTFRVPLLLLLLPSALIILTLGLYAVYSLHYRKYVYSTTQVPSMPVAIVFGAGIWPDGSLSDILADRVDTAIDLYRQGKVCKLLFTGDNRYLNYNEPQRMAEYAMERGVPEADIVLDYAGRRTYDSCYRARYIFEVESAILVTQAYHLPRALFTADRLGIRVVGVAADRHSYMYIRSYCLRELLATPVAWWQVLVSHPLPVLGPTLPIFPPK
jgi:SanA protein